MRKFRYIESGHGVESLTEHEKEELDMDFDINTRGFHVIAVLTKEEWEKINKSG